MSVTGRYALHQDTPMGRILSCIDDAKALREAGSTNTFEAEKMTHAPNEERTLTSQPIRQSQYRILVVDDEFDIRFLVKHFLEKNDFEVAEAGEWKSAMKQIEKFAPDLVLLDISMPGVPGNILVKTLRMWKPDVQVIMVTADSSELVRTQCLAYGAFAILTKPIDYPALKTTINQAISHTCPDSKQTR